MNRGPEPMGWGLEKEDAGAGADADAEDGARSGSSGERQTAWVRLAQSCGIMLAVWITIWAASSWRSRIIILQWCVPKGSGMWAVVSWILG